MCLDESPSCDVLKLTLEELVKESWDINKAGILGYSFKIMSANETLLDVTQGNETRNSKGAIQSLPKSISVNFKAYF